jgi:hypothetical protein
MARRRPVFALVAARIERIAAARPFLAREMRLLRALTHIVVHEMAAKLRA